MKKLALPTPQALENGTTISGCDVIRRMVLTLPFWKTDSNLQTIEACISIDEALDISPDKPIISDDAHGCLVRAMSLQNGTVSVQIQDPPTNRFYMKVFRSVLVAETVKEAPRAP